MERHYRAGPHEFLHVACRSFASGVLGFQGLLVSRLFSSGVCDAEEYFSEQFAVAPNVWVPAESVRWEWRGREQIAS